MKKTLGIIAVVSIIAFAAVPSFAGPVGNIADPAILTNGLFLPKGPFGLTIGAEADIMANRNIEDKRGDTDLSYHGYLAKISGIINNRFALYGLVGSGWAKHSFRLFGEDSELESDTHFVWGAGITVIAYEWQMNNEDVIRLGFDGRYRKSELDVSELRIGDMDYVLDDSKPESLEWDYDEWQVAMELSYQVYRFVPYIGVKYSDIEGSESFTIQSNNYEMDIEPDANIGIFLGASLNFAEMGALTVEGRMLDEIGGSVGVSIRF